MQKRLVEAHMEVIRVEDDLAWLKRRLEQGYLVWDVTATLIIRFFEKAYDDLFALRRLAVEEMEKDAEFMKTCTYIELYDRIEKQKQDLGY